MSSQDEDTLRRRLEEASLLGPDDPERPAVTAELAGLPDGAREEWRLLCAETELLRQEIRRVPVPANLDARLLAVADTHAAPRPSILRRFAWVAAAASVLVCAIVGGLLLLDRRARSERVRELAALAVASHVYDRHVTVETSDPDRLEQRLAGAVPFAVEVPDLGTAYRLVGGRKCALGTRAVVFSLWEGPAERCSVFQFDPGEFGLEDDLSSVEIRPSRGAGPPHPRVRIWIEDGRGYVSVHEETPTEDRP